MACRILHSSKGETEHSPLAQAGLGTDIAAVEKDNLPGDGKTNPRAREFILPMEPLEDPEQPVGVLHVEANPIVRNPVPGFSIHDSGIDADDRTIPH